MTKELSPKTALIATPLICHNDIAKIIIFEKGVIMEFSKLEHGKLIFSKTNPCVYRIIGKVVGSEGERTVQAQLFAGVGKEEATISETDTDWENLEELQSSLDPIQFASYVAMSIRNQNLEVMLSQLLGRGREQQSKGGIILPK